MDIAHRISALRKAQGMTQEQLADILGTTRQAVSKWESGKSKPDLDYAIAIGKYFSVTMDYLLLGKDNVTIIAEEPQSASPKRNWITSFSVLLASGFLLCLLLPLIADNYRNYVFQLKGVAFTDSNEYLFRWPLLGVTCIAIGSVLVGLCGVAGIWVKERTSARKV